MGQILGTQQDITRNKHYKEAQFKELTILEKYSDMKVGNEIQIENIKFQFNGRETFIHTLISGQQNNQCLVLLHGYLASSLFYYKMIKRLSQTYKVYSIDLLGMGLSDRQPFSFEQPKNAETAIKFFVDSLEEWRKAVGLESFILAGHSFGGFISFNYYLAHQDRIEQIYLLSPMSASSVQNEEDLRDDKVFQKYISSLSFKQSLFPRFMRFMHRKRATVSNFLQSCVVPSNYFINKIVDARFEFNSKEEKEDWKIYFKSIQFLPECTDHLIHELVSIPYVQSKLSMEELIQMEKLKDQQIPIHFIYGDYDWMDYSGTMRLLKSRAVIGTIKYVKNAGHLIPFEQPDALVDQIEHHIKFHKDYLKQLNIFKKQTLQYAM